VRRCRSPGSAPRTPQADRQCSEDNPDALTHHEALLPGHLLLKFLREQLETALEAFRAQVRRDLEQRPEVVNLQDEQYIRRTADRMQDVVRGRALAGGAVPARPFACGVAWLGGGLWDSFCRSPAARLGITPPAAPQPLLLTCLSGACPPPPPPSPGRAGRQV
jgi:hypothetical protein